MGISLLSIDSTSRSCCVFKWPRVSTSTAVRDELVELFQIHFTFSVLDLGGVENFGMLLMSKQLSDGGSLLHATTPPIPGITLATGFIQFNLEEEWIYADLCSMKYIRV